MFCHQTYRLEGAFEYFLITVFCKNFILEMTHFLFVKISFENTLTGKKNRTLISQQQIIPIIPILMYFDQEAMIANITLHISIGYFISNFA
jgi:hypothetical protein